MPNWTTNIVKFPNADTCAKAKRLFCDKSGNLDFNRVDPMPDTMHIHSTDLMKLATVCAFVSDCIYGIDLTQSASAMEHAIDIVIDTADGKMRHDIEMEFPRNRAHMARTIRRYLAALEEVGAVPVLPIFEFDMTDNLKTGIVNAIRFAVTEYAVIDHCPDALESFSDDDSLCCKGYIQYGHIIQHNIKEYGAPDWYTWSIEHWGVKWNASDTEWTDTEAVFKTPWNAPIPIIAEMSRRLDAFLLVAFADEDFGSGAGIAVCGPDGQYLERDYSFSVQRNSNDLANAIKLVFYIIDPEQVCCRVDVKTGEILWECEDDDRFDSIPELDLSHIDDMLNDFLQDAISELSN